MLCKVVRVIASWLRINHEKTFCSFIIKQAHMKDAISLLDFSIRVILLILVTSVIAFDVNGEKSLGSIQKCTVESPGGSAYIVKEPIWYVGSTHGQKFLPDPYTSTKTRSRHSDTQRAPRSDAESGDFDGSVRQRDHDPSRFRGQYSLYDSIGRGHTGEVWRASKVYRDPEGILHEHPESYVLKRIPMVPPMMESGFREVFVGTNLNFDAQDHIAKFVEAFVLPRKEEHEAGLGATSTNKGTFDDKGKKRLPRDLTCDSNSDPHLARNGLPNNCSCTSRETKTLDLWLVFRDEGLSLQQLLRFVPIKPQSEKQSASFAGGIKDSERNDALHANPDAAEMTLSPFWLRLRSSVSGPDVFQDIMHQLFSAVESIHSKLLTHRDIKPGNILVSAVPRDSDGSSESEEKQRKNATREQETKSGEDEWINNWEGSSSTQEVSPSDFSEFEMNRDHENPLYGHWTKESENDPEAANIKPDSNEGRSRSSERSEAGNLMLRLSLTDFGSSALWTIDGLRTMYSSTVDIHSNVYFPDSSATPNRERSNSGEDSEGSNEPWNQSNCEPKDDNSSRHEHGHENDVAHSFRWPSVFELTVPYSGPEVQLCLLVTDACPSQSTNSDRFFNEETNHRIYPKAYGTSFNRDQMGNLERDFSRAGIFGDEDPNEAGGPDGRGQYSQRAKLQEKYRACEAQDPSSPFSYDYWSTGITLLETLLGKHPEELFPVELEVFRHLKTLVLRRENLRERARRQREFTTFLSQYDICTMANKYGHHHWNEVTKQLKTFHFTCATVADNLPDAAKDVLPLSFLLGSPVDLEKEEQLAQYLIGRALYCIVPQTLEITMSLNPYVLVLFHDALVTTFNHSVEYKSILQRKGPIDPMECSLPPLLVARKSTSETFTLLDTAKDIQRILRCYCSAPTIPSPIEESEETRTTVPSNDEIEDILGSNTTVFDDRITAPASNGPRDLKAAAPKTVATPGIPPELEAVEEPSVKVLANGQFSLTPQSISGTAHANYGKDEPIDADAGNMYRDIGWSFYGFRRALWKSDSAAQNMVYKLLWNAPDCAVHEDDGCAPSTRTSGSFSKENGASREQNKGTVVEPTVKGMENHRSLVLRVPTARSGKFSELPDSTHDYSLLPQGVDFENRMSIASTKLLSHGDVGDRASNGLNSEYALVQRLEGHLLQLEKHLAESSNVPLEVCPWLTGNFAPNVEATNTESNASARLHQAMRLEDYSLIHGVFHANPSQEMISALVPAVVNPFDSIDMSTWEFEETSDQHEMIDLRTRYLLPAPSEIDDEFIDSDFSTCNIVPNGRSEVPRDIMVKDVQAFTVPPVIKNDPSGVIDGHNVPMLWSKSSEKSDETSNESNRVDRDDDFPDNPFTDIDDVSSGNKRGPSKHFIPLLKDSGVRVLYSLLQWTPNLRTMPKVQSK